eukprot:m.144599 g.144599  ORF g.144599 m.144599 type:complete len:91 (-) comp30384_c3_seq1:205-477(-)
MCALLWIEMTTATATNQQQQQQQYPPSLPSEQVATGDLPPPAYNQAIGYEPPAYVPDPASLGSNTPAVGVESAEGDVFADVDAWQKQNWK